MTFTFTVDCFPGFTKFNKKKKVMAMLQIVDSTDTTHNYKNKNIMGHEDRTKDSDVNEWYTKTVFNEAPAAAPAPSAPKTSAVK